eukprot:664044-Rhodomonas_salina.2
MDLTVGDPIIQDGIVLGADTRATEGPIVADKADTWLCISLRCLPTLPATEAAGQPMHWKWVHLLRFGARAGIATRSITLRQTSSAVEPEPQPIARTSQVKISHWFSSTAEH